jgi:O-antigen ligase/polysaccharide polymerase Wzy-like membrane protein
MTIDRLTKLLVFVSMAVAVVLEASLMAPGWRPVLPLTIIALALFSLISWWYPALAASLVLILTYTFPALIFVILGRFEYGTTTPWVAALLGVMTPMALRRGWALPGRWRTPLVLWALTVAVLWPIVALREADFHWMTLDVPRLSVTGLPGVPPLNAIMWSLNVALVLGAGILWFDWLCATFDRAEHGFRTTVIAALGVSWLASTVIGVYQLLVDVTFLNSGMFGFLQRASGLMFDANPFGVVAALGIPAAAAIALLGSWRGRNLAMFIVAIIAWLGLWGSGSRTAFAAVVIGGSFTLFYLAEMLIRRHHNTRRMWTLATAMIAIAVVIAPLLLQRSSAMGTWQRLRESAPGLTLRELWDRNGYGLTAAGMIREHPAVGVGVGAFHYLVHDFSRALGPGFLPVDNAQNWYRHQLVEFGLVGSLGWIWWTLSFGWFVLSSKVSGRTRPAAGALKGALVAIALISMLGMPTQNIALTLTFWTLAFWYLLLADEAGTGAPKIAHRSVVPATTWIGVASAVAICAAGTAYEARHDLRVPMRAARFGWPYSYGFYAPENGPGGEFRWAGRNAVAVVDATKPWVKLTIAVNHADVSRRPVDVTMAVDGAKVLSTTVSNSSLISFAPVSKGRSRIVVDASVSRVVRPADFGGADPRELGAMVQWEFVDEGR